MRISDWSSDVCSSDLDVRHRECNLGCVEICCIAEHGNRETFLGNAQQKTAVSRISAAVTPGVEPLVRMALLAQCIEIDDPTGHAALFRSEERRVGNECVS